MSFNGGQGPERARNHISMIASQVSASVRHGTPGWRHIAFINTTNTNYNCPTGLNLKDALQPHSMLKVYHTAMCVVGYKGIPVWVN